MQHDAQRARRPLSGQELLTLQLHARGYRPPQCCALAGHAQGACARIMAAAAAALGVAVADAVPEALRRGLLL